MQLHQILTSRPSRVVVLIAVPIAVGFATRQLGPVEAGLLALSAALLTKILAEIVVSLALIGMRTETLSTAIEEYEEAAIDAAGLDNTLSLPGLARRTEVLEQDFDEYQSSFSDDVSVLRGQIESAEEALAGLEVADIDMKRRLGVVEGSIGHVRRELSSLDLRAPDAGSESRDR